MTTTWYQQVTEKQNPKNNHAIRVTKMMLLQNFLNNTPPYSIYTEYVPYTLETYHVFLLADDNPAPRPCFTQVESCWEGVSKNDTDVNIIVHIPKGAIIPDIDPNTIHKQ